MPFGQSLRRAFLKFSCGHEGSQCRKGDPGVIPPSRVSPPQIERLNAAAPASSVPRKGRTPNIHKGSSGFPRALTPATAGRVEQRVGGGVSEAIQLSAVGPDHNRIPEPIHDTGCDRHSEPVGSSGLIRGRVYTPRNFNQPSSPLRNEIRRPSTDTQSSDYSNHTIAHSLCPTGHSTSRAYDGGQGTDAEPHETRKPKCLEKSPQPAVFIPTVGGTSGGGENYSSSHTITGIYHENSNPEPRQPLGTVPGSTNILRANMGDMTEEPRETWEQEPRGYGRMSKENGMEKYTHERLCADRAGRNNPIKKHKYHQYKSPTDQAPATTTQKCFLDPSIHTRIQPIEHEEVTNLITREIHHTDIRPIIQPIVATERLPRKHYLKTPDGKLVEISVEDTEKEGLGDVWMADWVVGKSIDNEIGAGEVEGKLSTSVVSRNNTPLPVLEAPHKSD